MMTLFYIVSMLSFVSSIMMAFLMVYDFKTDIVELTPWNVFLAIIVCLPYVSLAVVVYLLLLPDKSA